MKRHSKDMECKDGEDQAQFAGHIYAPPGFATPKEPEIDDKFLVGGRLLNADQLGLTVIFAASELGQGQVPNKKSRNKIPKDFSATQSKMLVNGPRKHEVSNGKNCQTNQLVWKPTGL